MSEAQIAGLAAIVIITFFVLLVIGCYYGAVKLWSLMFGTNSPEIKIDERSHDIALDEYYVKPPDMHDRWGYLSRGITSMGIILGAVSQILFGRELSSKDPIIGPYLIPFAIIWLIAFFHAAYVGLRRQLSAPIRLLCYGTLILFGTVLFWGAFIR